MTGERVVRRLAAILAADVVGYSRLMGRDESGTLARLKAHRTERLEPVLARHGGRLVKLTGDGALIEFPSAVDALSAAIEFQQAMTEANTGLPEDTAIVFRIGLHLGDLIVDGDDLYGDGVNVAARLEAEAPPGGIVVSRAVREAVDGRLKAKLHALGELSLKNIERPIRAFRVEWDTADWQATATPAHTAAPNEHTLPAPATPALVLPDKPSIAVLPFQNMSGDPEQEYFADGIVEDIITALSRFKSLFVIARNSSFSYKGKSPDIRQVGKDLGVRYVLEGSIRKAANRIRVTAQLIDTLSGNHIWAERYDRVLDDIFAVQEELTQSIVGAIAPHISDVEVARARRQRPDSLSAYEMTICARAKIWLAASKNDSLLREEAIAELRAALTIDPASTIALDVLALACWQQIQWLSTSDVEGARKEGVMAAARSIELDRTGNIAHSIRGVLLCQQPDLLERREAMADLQLGYELNPNDIFSLASLAFGKIAEGDPVRAMDLVRQALRISPRDSLRGMLLFQMARACLATREYGDGVEWAELALGERATDPGALRILALNLVGLGKIEGARAALQKVSSLSSAYIEAGLHGRLGYHKPEHFQRALIFLRVAADLEKPSAAEAVR